MIERIDEKNNSLNEIKIAIQNLKLEIQQFNKISNEEIVWLFLATVGCWGIPTEHPVFRAVAFLMIFLIFTSRLKNALGNSQPFQKRIQEIENSILRNCPKEDDFTKARKGELCEIEKKYLSKSAILKINWIFFLCWLFYGYSMVMIIGELPKQL